MNVGTNNGLERQNGALKHQYLHTLRKHSLSAMLKILVEEFLPDKYEGYVFPLYSTLVNVSVIAVTPTSRLFKSKQVNTSAVNTTCSSATAVE